MIPRRSSCIVRYLFCIIVVLVILLFINLNQQQSLKRALFTEIPDSAKAYILFEEEKTVDFNITDLKRLIKRRNEEEHIHNIDVFGKITSNINIIVIRVDKFSERLKLLLASLSAVKGIQDVLIIFSHSFFDENVNRIVEKIDFCRVLQIFYPFSLQLHPDDFPGFHSQDCPYDLDVYTAKYLKCTGASNPDIHGRYRKPENAQMKHHWWWTANKVFDNISCLERNNGVVMFMDDDNFLLEDFMYLVIYMKKVANSMPFCEIISLGVYDPQVKFTNENDTYRLQITTWDPKYSEVIGFDYSTWNTLASHFDLYCLLDDYSWSRSIQYISLNRLDGKRFKVISSVMPRSFKSSCGLKTVTQCGVNEGIFEALSIHKQQKKNLFPPYFEVYSHIELIDDEYIIFDVMENNGGWNDNRDKDLCNTMTIHKVKKILLDMKYQLE
ncbi:unnamed protein product [Colias eurytheme]|nr:unnamed protein product [Colias eurytheme]